VPDERMTVLEANRLLRATREQVALGIEEKSWKGMAFHYSVLSTSSSVWW
jgi:hypothetical protein